MTNKFKEGDWVYSEKNPYKSIRPNPTQITKIDSIEDRVWCRDNINESHISINQFQELYRLATIEEIPQEFRPKSINLIETLIL